MPERSVPRESPSKKPTVKVAVPRGTEISRSRTGWLRVTRPVPLAMARNRASVGSQVGRQLKTGCAHAGDVESRRATSAQRKERIAKNLLSAFDPFREEKGIT